MKKFSETLLALALSGALLCPAAMAAESTPALRMEGKTEGNIQLTLEQLGEQEVNSIQLTLTLKGNYSKADFAVNEAVSGQYSKCLSIRMAQLTWVR